MDKNEPKLSVSRRYVSNEFRPKMTAFTVSCVQKLFVGPGRFLLVMSDDPTRFGELYTFLGEANWDPSVHYGRLPNNQLHAPIYEHAHDSTATGNNNLQQGGYLFLVNMKLHRSRCSFFLKVVNNYAQ